MWRHAMRRSLLFRPALNKRLNRYVCERLHLLTSALIIHARLWFAAKSLYCTHASSPFYLHNEWTKRTRNLSLFPPHFAERTREKQRDLSGAVGSRLEKFHAMSRSARPKTTALTRPPFSASALHETGNQICTRAYSWLVPRAKYSLAIHR